MPTYIEEDFRFATKVEVENYSSADLIRKPHLCGFEFSQLLDQIDGQVIACNNAGRRFTGFIRAPGGTASWLAKHLSTNEFDTELIMSIELGSFDELSMKELHGISNVIAALPSCSDNLITEYAATIDCSILACLSGVLDWVGLIERDRWLRQKPAIVYDPNRLRIGHKQGHYFMSSSIWRSEWE